MSIGRRAEAYVQSYFAAKGVTLRRVTHGDGELGFDFRSEDSSLFVEVKGTAAKDLKSVLFRYFTNSEYEKARSCRRAKQKYEIHLIVGVGTPGQEHYVIPGNLLLQEAKPEVSWALPLRKSASQYRVGAAQPALPADGPRAPRSARG